MQQNIIMAAASPYEEKKIAITSSAYQRLQDITKQQGKPQVLIIQVDPGGCSGYQYQLSLAEQAPSDALYFTHQGIGVSIDAVSFSLLEGLVIDYVEEMMGAYFMMKNPNATASCGCGNSFTVF